MWIQNVSKHDIIMGNHRDPGDNTMLIQIMDPDEGFPKPKYKFSECHQFEFLDVEGHGYTNFGDDEVTDVSDQLITDDQAKQLSKLLLQAKERNMNIVVHCYAGIFRSGAVAEVGVMLGFEDTQVFRSPNRLVKHKLLQALGMKYNPREPMTVNGKSQLASKNTILFAGHRENLTKNKT
jgi:rhodanese-related sulfurtransferase